MQLTQKQEPEKSSPGSSVLAFIFRIVLAIAIPLIAFFVLYQGFSSCEQVMHPSG